jgi:hypothetical protein
MGEISNVNAVYKGTFYECLCNGQGRLETSLGEIYEGDYKNGMFHG